MTRNTNGKRPKPTAQATDRLTVVIPCRNAEGRIEKALEAIRRSEGVALEIIVVSDASDDDTARIAEGMEARVIVMPERSGPGICRNRGAAAATCENLLFIDDDVLVRPDTAKALVDVLRRQPEVSAVVGMVEARTHIDNPASRYFNFRKHYDYKVLKGPLTNLYTSVTAIRTQVFLESGGFDERVKAIAVEDAELGRRLVREGHRIALCREARVQHLKRHTFKTLMQSDHTRATHFMKLLLRDRLTGDLVKHKRFASFRMGAIVSAAVGPATLAILPLAPLYPPIWPVSAAGAVALLVANKGFLSHSRSVFGTASVLPMSMLLLADSVAVSSGLVRGGVSYLLGRKR